MVQEWRFARVFESVGLRRVKSVQNVSLLFDVFFALRGSLPGKLIEHYIEEKPVVRGYDNFEFITFIFQQSTQPGCNGNCVVLI